MSKGIYLFWDNKYEQVIYAGRFTGRKRIKAHFMPSLKNSQPINKYVQEHKDRIESIIFCEFDNISDNDLNQLEKETIKLFKLNKYKHPDSFVFNFTDGGDGSSGRILSDKTREKISKGNLGKKMSEESKQKNRESQLGKKHTEETKQKIRESSTGRKLSNEARKKISEANKNKKISEETRKKMSESHKGEKNHMWGKKHTEETKRKISENNGAPSGKKHPKYRHDVPSPQELLIEYNSSDITQKELAKKYNCSLHLIETRLRKARKDGG